MPGLPIRTGYRDRRRTSNAVKYKNKRDTLSLRWE